MRLNRIITTFALATITVVAACGKDDKSTNSALQNDLSLAAQQQTRVDSISALEAGTAGTAANPTVRAPATVRRTTASAPRRSTTTRRSTGGTSSGSTAGTVSSGSNGEVVTTVQKNTKRDAAIGAAAGAVIGATTSRDKVKGAVIGGVIGGVLGGVIGNNVDVKKTTTKKPPI